MKFSSILTLSVILGTLILPGCGYVRTEPYENALNNPNNRFKLCQNPEDSNYILPDECNKYIK